MRLGVALLVPEPVSTELDGLRRACGDGALDAVQPHLTLVPPVNVSRSRLGDALAVLRAATARVRSLTLSLGPVTTFLPDSPTLYLTVHGEQLETLHRLRDSVFRPPLERTLTFAFVPHVTIAESMEADRLHAAVTALRDYTASVTFDGVHLLQEVRDDRGRRWMPIAAYRFGEPIVVGRGGLPVDLFVGDILDPEARDLLDQTLAEGSGHRLADQGADDDLATCWRSLAVMARRRGELVGAVAGWTDGRCSRVDAIAVREPDRGQGIARHLYARFVAEGGEPAT
jgi:2'-5' RNA ligase